MTVLEHTPAPIRKDAPPFGLVAPVRHTAILVALFLGLAAAGAIFQKESSPGASVPSPASPIGLYLSILAAEAGLLYFVSRGLKRSGTSLRDVVGGGRAGAGSVLVDLLLAAALWGTWKLVSLVLGHLFGPDRAAPIDGLLPRTALEIALWILVSITAGICEEIVFRGYLQRQFAALTGSRWIAVTLQALVFGIAHGYQGVAASGRIALFGLLFGMLALWRGSLKPGIVAHAGTDILAGIFRI